MAWTLTDKEALTDIIMKKDDGISDPLTLCFSRDFKKLFVSNEGGEQVVVYNCEY